jgi:hypothetical protein
MDTLLWKSCILILLPMIPAIIIFKVFPDARGDGEGALYGLRWKFGGAFAAYVFVALLLLVATRSAYQTRDAEVWMVRGTVNAKHIPNISNILSVRSLPRTLYVESDGSYEFRVIVDRVADKLVFPKLVFDLSRACLGVRAVPLDGSAGTFSAALGSPKDLRVVRRDDDKAIDVDPLVLEPAAPIDAHCPQ